MASLDVTGKSVIGDLLLVTFTFDYDSSYTSGGEPLSRSALGFSSVVRFLECSPCKGLIFEYDYDNETLKALFPTGGAGTPATGLAVPSGLAATGAVTASAVDATRPTVAILPGVGKEVPSTQNLSTLTGVHGYAYGI